MSVFSNIYKNSYDKIDVQTAQNNVENTFAMYEIFENMLVNSFVWKNLPVQKDGKPIYYTRPEQYLYYRGLMAAFIDDDGETGLIYPAFPCGSLRDDGFYTEYIMYSFNGKNWRRNFEDIELCENLPNQLPTRPLVFYYIERMKSVLSTIDVQIIKSRGGDIFEVMDEKQAEQVAKLWENMTKNRPIQTIINDSYQKKEIQKLTVYDSRESQILDMWDIYDKFKHEFLTYFGINNTETEKKERLLTDEVNANNELIAHGLYESQYLCRLDFCSRCNEHFGWNILCLKNRCEDSDEGEVIVEETIGENTEIAEIIEEIKEETESEKEVVEDVETGETDSETND